MYLCKTPRKPTLKFPRLVFFDCAARSLWDLCSKCIDTIAWDCKPHVSRTSLGFFGNSFCRGLPGLAKLVVSIWDSDGQEIKICSIDNRGHAHKLRLACVSAMNAVELLELLHFAA